MIGKKVFIAGGSGLIGTNLAVRLAELGAIVTATYHTREPKVSDSRIHYIPVDLLNKEACMKAMENNEYLYICATSKFSAGLAHTNPASKVSADLTMTANLCEAAYKTSIEKIFYISSVAVYPDIDKKLEEDDIKIGEPRENLFYYGWLKRFSETLLNMYSKSSCGVRGLDVVCFRPTAVYGPYDDFEPSTSYVVPAMLRKALEHKPMEIWGDGRAKRNFVYVEDLVSAIVSSEKITGFEVFNIASEESCTIQKLAEISMEVSQKEDRSIRFDLDKPSGDTIFRVSIKKAEELLGYKAETTLREGLTKTLQWYQEDMRRKGDL